MCGYFALHPRVGQDICQRQSVLLVILDHAGDEVFQFGRDAKRGERVPELVGAIRPREEAVDFVVFRSHLLDRKQLRSEEEERDTARE